jgi:tetratricopeptide (TPR) repeat protein
MPRYLVVKRIAVLTLMAILVLGVEMVFPAGVSQSHQVLAAPQQNGIDTMAMAHQLYESGQYAKAAEAYQQLVDQGYSDAALFYNLGNAYFKQGDIGRAILNYRRAERLHPRDPDTRANLELARSLAVDQIEDGNQSGLLYQ